MKRNDSDAPVTVEELSIKTFEQGGRMHRQFNYHISRPLPPKPKPVVPVVEEKVVEIAGEKPKQDCVVVQQSNTCVHFKTSNSKAVKNLKCLSTTNVKVTPDHFLSLFFRLARTKKNAERSRTIVVEFNAQPTS